MLLRVDPKPVDAVCRRRDLPDGVRGESHPADDREAAAHERNTARRRQSVQRAQTRGAVAADQGKPIRCVYVSNASMYKHQWVVVKAIGHLAHPRLQYRADARRRRLRPRHAEARAERSRAAMRRGRSSNAWDSCGTTICRRLLADANLFVFASSCENMPNTLVEAMAVGLPIACSDRGPMPEVLRDGGRLFRSGECDVR